jgi:CheY-like chemotaxis protein
MDLSALRVLVVDDDAAARGLLAEVLEALGAHVRVVSCAQDARVALANEQPDVLISDVSMPGEDGCELLRAIRSLPRAQGGRVPAVAFTAAADAGTHARALACGFDAVVQKPLDIAVLGATLNQLAEMADRLPDDRDGADARDS